MKIDSELGQKTSNSRVASFDKHEGENLKTCDRFGSNYGEDQVLLVPKNIITYTSPGKGKAQHVKFCAEDKLIQEHREGHTLGERESERLERNDGNELGSYVLNISEQRDAGPDEWKQYSTENNSLQVSESDSQSADASNDEGNFSEPNSMESSSDDQLSHDPYVEAFSTKGDQEPISVSVQTNRIENKGTFWWSVLSLDGPDFVLKKLDSIGSELLDAIAGSTDSEDTATEDECTTVSSSTSWDGSSHEDESNSDTDFPVHMSKDGYTGIQNRCKPVITLTIESTWDGSAVQHSDNGAEEGSCSDCVKPTRKLLRRKDPCDLTPKESDHIEVIDFSYASENTNIVVMGRTWATRGPNWSYQG